MSGALGGAASGAALGSVAGPWGTVIGAGVGLVGGLLGSSGASNAAKQQAAAQAAALQFQQGVYNTAQENLNPYISGGQGALSTLLGFYGLPGGNTSGATQGFNQFQNTQSYQFPLQQANLATNRSLAASGLSQSGGALRDLSQLNSGYASQGLGQYLNGITGIANQGQGAAQSLGGLGNQAAGTVLQGQTGLGNAQAAGTIGSTNAWTNALSNSLPGINSLGSSAYNSNLFQNGLWNATNPGYGGTAGGAGAGTLQSLGFYNPISGG